MECRTGILDGLAQDKGHSRQEQAQEGETQTHVGYHRQCRKHRGLLQATEEYIRLSMSTGQLA